MLLAEELIPKGLISNRLQFWHPACLGCVGMKVQCIWRLEVRRILGTVLVAVLTLTLGQAAKADTVLGVPVTGINSTTQAVPNCPTVVGQSCYNTSNGQTVFFIPLSTAASGTFGVTNGNGIIAGTSADTGSGVSNALTVYLLFSPVNVPVSTATLTFHFVDLDLIGVNDPFRFFETVQFFSASGTALTQPITTNGQSDAGSFLSFTVSGTDISQTIFFDDVSGIVDDPFYVKLVFGSEWYQNGKNTPEKMKAILETTPASVPEPGTLLLLGTGLAAIALRRRLMRR